MASRYKVLLICFDYARDTHTTICLDQNVNMFKEPPRPLPMPETRNKVAYTNRQTKSVNEKKSSVWKSINTARCEANFHNKKTNNSPNNTLAGPWPGLGLFFCSNRTWTDLNGFEQNLNRKMLTWTVLNRLERHLNRQTGDLNSFERIWTELEHFFCLDLIPTDPKFEEANHVYHTPETANYNPTCEPHLFDKNKSSHHIQKWNGGEPPENHNSHTYLCRIRLAG